MIATAERVTQRFHPVSAPDYLPAHLLRDLQLGRLQATVRPYGLFACPLSEVVRLHASSGTTGKPIVVAYTQDDLNVWTSVMARALSREDKPVPNATVVLLPAEPNRRFPDTVRTATADDAGHVTLKDVPPGNYIAFAWEEVEDGIWFDADFVTAQTQAGRVQIGPKAKEQMELSLIPASK
jgi:hypothetical protein